MVGSSKLAHGGWLALLVGVALAACPATVPATPEDAPPQGFAWEELKDFRAWVLRPEGWGFRQMVGGVPSFDLSPVPFTGPAGVKKGVMIHLMSGTKQPADEAAAQYITQCASDCKVLRGWTRKRVPAEPFTSYGLVGRLRDKATGIDMTYEAVFVANRATNAIYYYLLSAPTAEWKDVEPPGETMLANLRLDPTF